MAEEDHNSMGAPIKTIAATNNSPSFAETLLKGTMDDNSTDSNNSNSISREVEDDPLQSLPTPAAVVEVEEPADDQDGLNAAATDDATTDDEASIRTTVVKFSTLEIREYPLCIGDNPGAASGPPISLDWAWYTGEEGDDEDPGILVLDLEQYESYRGTRRTLQGMCRGERRRTYILQEEWGYTMHQIRAATRPVNITRAQRKKTLNSFNGGLHKLHYFIEKVVRAITGGGRKRKEKELMDSVHAMLGNKQIGDSISCTNKSSSQTTDSLKNVFAVQEAAAAAAAPPCHDLQ